MNNGRKFGHHYVKGSPLTYREKLEALWAAEPMLDAVVAAHRTGASRAVANTVQRRLREAGKIPVPKRQQRPSL